MQLFELKLYIDNTAGCLGVWVCVYFRPPVYAVCSNYEVVVFQPRTGTAQGLGSVAS